MGDFGCIIERYCPVVKRNVPVEVSYQPSGIRHECCLNKGLCMQERGICAGFDHEP